MEVTGKDRSAGFRPPPMALIQARAWFMDLSVTSMMFRPPTVTASASGFRRRPAQDWHDMDAMYRSISDRM